MALKTLNVFLQNLEVELLAPPVPVFPEHLFSPVV